MFGIFNNLLRLTQFFIFFSFAPLQFAMIILHLFKYQIILLGKFFRHYSLPHTPVIPGLENFKGTVSHSHDYRKPEYFKNKNAIVLGAASSGIDIGLDLVKAASKVYLSHNHEK